MAEVGGDELDDEGTIMSRRRLLTILVLGVGWLLVGIAAGAPTSVPKPPKESQQLMDLGRVEFQFYDPKKEPRERPGKATFKLAVKWDFKTKFKWKREGDVKQVGDERQKGGQREGRMSVEKGATVEKRSEPRILVINTRLFGGSKDVDGGAVRSDSAEGVG